VEIEAAFFALTRRAPKGVAGERETMESRASGRGSNTEGSPEWLKGRRPVKAGEKAISQARGMINGASRRLELWHG
jgi:hypothetical protein